MLEPATVVLLVLLGTLTLFVTDLARYDVIALIAVLSLVLTGCRQPAEGFAGFASEAVVVIACMSVFGHALTRWGVGEAMCQRLITGKGYGEGALVLRLVLISGVLASFMTDTAVVAILIPIAASIARDQRIPISRLLIPITFGCFLGDLLLVIGSAKNIALNGVLMQNGAVPFGVLDLAPFGLIVLALGALYMRGPGRALLPRTPVDESLTEHYHVPKFITEVLVEPSSELISRSVAELPRLEEFGITVVGIVRGGGEGTILAPGPYNRVRRGDTLILQGEPEAIVRLRQSLGLRVRESVQVGETRLAADDVKLVEAVVPAASPLVGRTLVEADFRARTNLNALAISKHGEVQAQKIGHIALDVGDTLLIQGHARDLERARRDRALVLLGEVETPPLGRGAWLSVVLLLAVLALSTSGVLTLAVAALCGAVALVLTRCVPVKEVYPAIDWMVIVLIGGMLALGKAFDKYELGDALVRHVAGLGSLREHPHVLLALLCTTAVVLAQVTTSVGTAVLLTPVALSLAQELSLSDRPFLMAVLAGTNCAFLSPVANPANAMIVGPGNYRFRDFLRVGTPLTLLIVLAATLLLPVLWPFHVAG